MPDFSAAAKARMQAQAKRFKEGRGSGKHVSLSGQNAIVEPGQTVIVRILPRWDFALKAYTKTDSGAWVKNPDYQPEEAYATGSQHWFTGPDGRRKPEWCRKSLSDDEPCPLCEMAATYKGSADEAERQAGYDMEAKEVVLYNVVLRRQMLGEDGRPAIKILTVTPTLWLSINRAAGGEGEEAVGFSIGDYTDWEAGYDWKIYRPAARKAGVKQESYSAEHASQPSRLYPPEHAARWKGWQTLLYDLDAEIRDNVKSYEELYTMVYGTAPTEIPTSAGADDPGGGADQLPVGGDDGFGGGDEPPTDTMAPPETFTPETPAADFDLPPELPTTAAPRRTAPPTAPMAAPPVAASRRTTPAAAPAAAARKAPPLRPGPARRR